MQRRDFLKSLLLVVAGCATPNLEVPSFKDQVEIDFYGLTHMETPKELAKTRQRIEKALCKNYDLISLEWYWNLEESWKRRNNLRKIRRHIGKVENDRGIRQTD